MIPDFKSEVWPEFKDGKFTGCGKYDKQDDGSWVRDNEWNKQDELLNTQSKDIDQH